jgi:translation initiation factor IF-2
VAKARVSALAKEVGKTSKELIEWLNNNGEYVKTPSSTVEAPVVAKVYAAFPKVAAPADADGGGAA